MSLIKRKVLNKVAFWISCVKLIPILRKVNASSLIIDCGANKGDISALFLAKNASVIAFEPDPLAFKLLESRFEGHDNIQCINKAVDYKESTANLYFHKARRGDNHSAYTVSSSLIEDKVNVIPDGRIEVETIDINSYILKLDKRVNILKMDVEGAEINILKKIIQNQTYKKIDLILVETHQNKIPGHKEKVADLKVKIRDLGITNIKLNWI